MIRFYAAAAGLCVMLAAPAAFAQAPIEDAVVQGQVLNRNVDQAASPLSRQDAGANEIDGEAGVYVLTVNEIYSVSAASSLGYNSNPTRTAGDAGGDWYADLGGRLAVSTRLDDRVDFSAALNLDAREYFDTDAASSRGLSLTAALGMPLFADLYFSVIGFAGYSADKDLENEVAFQGLALNVSAAYQPTERLTLRPGLGLMQQWSGISENNSVTATVSLDAFYRIAPRWLVSTRVSVAEREYDDFYEDVTFVARDDTTFGASASLIWRPTDVFTAAVGLSYEDQDSSLFLSSYEAFDSGVFVSVKRSF